MPYQTPAIDNTVAFTDAHQVGVRDYLRAYQHSPLTSLDIDRFIERTISDPAHPRAWNAGYLAGWLAGMASLEGSTDYTVAQIHHAGSEGAPLHLVEVNLPMSTSQQQPSCYEGEYTVIPVIPLEDPPVHTAAHPFCDDPRCLCHDDQDSIAQVYDLVQQGLFTPQEATAFVAGTIGRW